VAGGVVQTCSPGAQVAGQPEIFGAQKSGPMQASPVQPCGGVKGQCVSVSVQVAGQKLALHQL